jgi:coenzyme F420 hydrogenase subunit beta
VKKRPAIETILDRRLCLGCGACAYLGASHGVAMRDYPNVGRRPTPPDALPEAIKREMAEVCPGIEIEARLPAERAKAMGDDEILIGPSAGIWEGWAADGEIRFNASSGGVITALAAYCVERRGMAFALHTGMSAEEPWRNETVLSRTRRDLIRNSGSRYSPSSPIEAIASIEGSDRPCVFIGKPCDAAAVDRLRAIRPGLDRNLGLVLSFFCAGTPATSATVEVAESLGKREGSPIKSLRYRGQGWPGLFKVGFENGREASLTYEESWGMLSRKKRQLRCHLSPHGRGELSDVTCGDAWHRKAEGTDGISIVIARTERGREIVEGAIREGYIVAAESDARNVVKAQVLTERRKVVRARILGLKLFGLPAPRFPGFFLDRASAQESVPRRIRETLGMARRVALRGYLRPEERD